MHAPLYGSAGFRAESFGSMLLSERERAAIALAVLFYDHEDVTGLSAEQVRATLAGLLGRTQGQEARRAGGPAMDDTSPSAAWDA